MVQQNQTQLSVPVFNIARCSLHDGEGIRTVVYLKGCSLRCFWCHNPEGIRAETEIACHPVKCIRCGRCAAVCPNCHGMTAEGMYFDRGKCRMCLQCAYICPNRALEICGPSMTVDEVFTEAVKDRHFYDSSGGGVTISGGECLMYPDFCAGLFEKCRGSGIHTAVESAMNVSWNSIETVAPLTDAFLCDFKLADSEKHRKYCGVGNGRIMDNIRRLSFLHGDICIRIPLIPHINDSEDHLQAVVEFLNTCGNGIKTAELLKYNHMAQNKYTAIGRPQLFPEEIRPFGTLSPQTDEEMENKRQLLREYVRDEVKVI